MSIMTSRPFISALLSTLAGLVLAAAADEGGLLHLGPNITSVYFVGDLHGDDYCAKHAVERTGLVDFGREPWAWLGPQSSALVFMGDLVDKGVRSKQTGALVQRLSELHPNNVLAVMGNVSDR